MTDYLYFPDGYVFAKYRMDDPHRGLFNCNAFDQYILTFIRLYKVRAQVVTFTEYPILHGHTIFSHFLQTFICIFLRWRAFFQFTFLSGMTPTTFPEPPVFIICLSVKFSLSCDGNILLLISIY